MNNSRVNFYVGLFVSAAVVLALQILHTRYLSVSTWYFVAFFTISMAMLGMTVGALIVYFLPAVFSAENFRYRLAQIATMFSASIGISWVLLISTSVVIGIATPLLSALVVLKLIMVMAPPYIFGGILISLALTRSPYPAGRVYAVDLMGAAAGCILVIGLMEVLDGVSALLAVGVLAGCGAICFAMSAAGEQRAAATSDQRDPRTVRPAAIATMVMLLIATIGNTTIYPNGGRIVVVKNQISDINNTEAHFWNSFSRIEVSRILKEQPFLWGPSPAAPPSALAPIEHRHLKIDGLAGTPMYRFDKDKSDLSVLRYDVTNLAYEIRNSGSSAVIGIGGGRDLIAARTFGFTDITGVEINSIFAKNLLERYTDFNQIGVAPGVNIVVDEGRSWFARTEQRFDLIQMSLIDTWAATGVGAFSLTENGLYTIEAWHEILSNLKDDGVFTVSRWYSPDNVGETGRLVALAKAALWEVGAKSPNDHMFLAGADRLATIVVGRRPLKDQDLETLRSTSDELGYVPLYDPEATPENRILRVIHEASNLQDLERASDGELLNFSPPDDSQPFFFNQLKLGSIPAYLASKSFSGGVISGNLIATAVLAIIVLVSLMVALATVIFPALPSVRNVSPGLAWSGSSFFLLIGLGFMFVEIGLMQRLSVFLGHPVYGLAVALAGIILSTGLGSALSERYKLDTGARLIGWIVVTTVYLALVPFWLPELTQSFASYGIYIRSIVAFLAILPAGLALGFGFPTGMRLASAIDQGPTPWFWAINGAAGVFASGIAVAVGTFVSIDSNLYLAAICYALLSLAGLKLLSLQTDTDFLSEKS